MKRSTGLVLTGVLAVLVAVLVLVFVLQLSQNPDAQTTLGDRYFTIGDAHGVGNAIDRDGPLFFKDPLGRGRDIVLVRDAGRFHAYAARSGDGCHLDLDREAKALRDSCTNGSVTVAELRGRTEYVTRIEKGKLLVDLRTEG